MNVLVLTDHKTHAEGESIYPLLQAMAQHAACQDLFVASRKRRPENDDFFTDNGGTRLVARRIDDRFRYRNDGAWFLENGAEVNGCDFDVIFLRVDRPVENSYLDSLANRFPSQKIINDPKGIQETGAKDYLLQFPEVCPPMRLCRTIEDVEEEASRHPIVLKPLRGYGGKELLRIDGQTAWYEDQQTTFEEIRGRIQKRLEKEDPKKEKEHMLAVKFLPTIHLGDKRILVVNGQVLGAMLRIPQRGSWLANMTQGGTSHFAELDPEEQAIAATISPLIVERGVVIFGFDTLVGDDGKRVLSEINTLNVGGLTEAEEHSGEPVIARAAELIWEHLLAS